MGDAIEEHPQSEAHERKQDEDKVGGLFTSQLERIETAFLRRVDLVNSSRKRSGVARIEELSTCRGNRRSDVLRSSGFERNADVVDTHAILASPVDFF